MCRGASDGVDMTRHMLQLLGMRSVAGGSHARVVLGLARRVPDGIFRAKSQRDAWPGRALTRRVNLAKRELPNMRTPAEANELVASREVDAPPAPASKRPARARSKPAQPSPEAAPPPAASEPQPVAVTAGR